MGGFEWEPTIEDLRWLERLALALVGDAHEARDLAQTTLVASARGAPSAPAERRLWMFGALRNLDAKRRRGLRRRAGYEAEGARSEALPSPEELAMRTEEQQRLLGIVRSLPEAYRTPLLLRYYEDASPATIAARLDLPTRTVHTRLHRGLKLLRERLDAEHPRGREGWLAALLPLARLDRGTAAPVAQAFRPGAAAVVATVVVCVVAVAWVSLTSRGPTNDSSRDVARSTDPSIEEVDLVRVEPADVRETAPVTLAGEPATLDVGVVDWKGRPMRGVEIVQRRLEGLEFRARSAVPMQVVAGPEEHATSTTDQAGIATLARPLDDSLFSARASGHVTAVMAGWRTSRPDEVPVIVLAPSRWLAVRVVDAEQRSVPGLRAWVVLEGDAAPSLPRTPEGAHVADWPCDYEGDLLTAPEIPDVEEAQLVIQVAGGPTRRWPLEEVGSEIVWAPTGDVVVRGVLVDGSGGPLRGFVMDRRGHWSPTAADGSFSLTVESGSPGLWGVAGGFAPQRIAVTADRAGVDVGAIELASPAGSIRGRVVDEDGIGRPAVSVLVDDPTICGEAHSGIQLESLAAGGVGVRSMTRTDEDGRFRIDGLRRDREYRLRLSDESSAQWLVTESLVVDAECRLELPRRAIRVHFTGRVVDDRGQPLANASVAVWGPGHGEKDWRPFLYGDRATTDDHGRFTLKDVPAVGVSLSVDHPAIRRTVVPVQEWGDGETRAFARAAQLRIELVDGDAASTVSFEDAAGNAVTAWRLDGLGRREVGSVRFVDGRTPVLEVGCDVRTAVLWSSGRVVRRAPIRPVAGALNEITL